MIWPKLITRHESKLIATALWHWNADVTFTYDGPVFSTNLRKQEIHLCFASFNSASAKAIDEQSLGYLKVKGRGILKCILQAKKKKSEHQNWNYRMHHAKVVKP